VIGVIRMQMSLSFGRPFSRSVPFLAPTEGQKYGNEKLNELIPRPTRG
jgi:hypothetical protein